MKKAEITIPAEIDYLVRVRNFIERTGLRHAFSHKEIHAIMLAVEEACTNIIRHGYQNMNKGKIQIEAIIKKPSLTLTIIDQGQTYDPRREKAPDLARYVEIGKVGGLGIMMIRKLMDEIDYSVTKRGNEFRLIKYREAFRSSKFFKIWLLLHKNEMMLLITLSISLGIIVGIILSLLTNQL